jgi:hypothetical protein
MGVTNQEGSMQFLSSWSWWLIEIVQVPLMLMYALGAFGHGSRRDLLTVVGAILGFGAVVLQVVLHGFFAALFSAAALLFVIQPQTRTLVLRYLGARGVVHVDPQVALDIARAEGLREMSRERLRRLLETKGLEALWTAEAGFEQEAKRRDMVMCYLRDPMIAQRTGLDEQNADRLVRLIQELLGPIEAGTLARIATNASALEAYEDYLRSERAHSAETRLHYAITLGRLPEW